MGHLYFVFRNRYAIKMLINLLCTHLKLNHVCYTFYPIQILRNTRDCQLLNGSVEACATSLDFVEFSELTK